MMEKQGQVLEMEKVPAWLKNAADDAKNGRIYKGL